MRLYIALALMGASALTALAAALLREKHPRSEPLLKVVAFVLMASGIVGGTNDVLVRGESERAADKDYQHQVAVRLFDRYQLRALSTFEAKLPSKDRQTVREVLMERGDDLVECLLNTRKGADSVTAHCAAVKP